MAYRLLPSDAVEEDEDGPSSNPFGQSLTYFRWFHSRRYFPAYYFALSGLLILLAIPFYFSRASIYVYSEPPPLNSSQVLEASVFEIMGLPKTISYARTEIFTKFYKSEHIHNDSQARTFTPTNDTLPAFHKLTLDVKRTEIAVPDAACTKIQLDLPEPAVRPNASHLLCGVATQLDRLKGSLPQFAHWAGHTGVKMIALIPKGSNRGELDRVRKEAANLGVDMTIKESKLKSHEDQFFSLVKELYENRQHDTEWAVIMDDDTFFPSITALVRYLSGYDASKPWYIGGLTEDFGQMATFGVMGYGGAGIFLSIPLLAQLNVPKVYKQCFEHKAIGDRQVADCIYMHTLTKLTAEPLLHQLDLAGDASGFYESGRTLPLSIHHWKSWHTLNVTAMAAVASVCGEACLLKRWKFTDSASQKPWYLTNGHSLVQYSKKLDDDDISMEHTWDAQGDFGYSLEPLRPKDEKKVQFKLEAVWKDDSGATVRQFYVRRLDKGVVRVHDIIWRREATSTVEE